VNGLYNFYFLLLQAILNRGGRYLEAMIQGSKKDAEEGNLICMAAGDKSLFDDCKSSFDAISASATHIGKFNIVLYYKFV